MFKANVIRSCLTDVCRLLWYRNVLHAIKRTLFGENVTRANPYTAILDFNEGVIIAVELGGGS